MYSNHKETLEQLRAKIKIKIQKQQQKITKHQIAPKCTKNHLDPTKTHQKSQPTQPHDNPPKTTKPQQKQTKHQKLSNPTKIEQNPAHQNLPKSNKTLIKPNKTYLDIVKHTKKHPNVPTIRHFQQCTIFYAIVLHFYLFYPFIN